MNADLQTLITHLQDKTGLVEVDLPPVGTSADLSVATRISRDRRNAINRGQRVAHLYKLIDGLRSATQDRGSLQIVVSADEAEQLIALGAKWVGPAEYAPRGTLVPPTRLVEQLELRNFKAHRDTILELERFTLLVGDNACGKSSVLDAIRLLTHLSSRAAFHQTWPQETILRRGAEGPVLLTAKGRNRTKHWELAGHLEPVDDDNRAWDITATGRVGEEALLATLNSPPQRWTDVVHSTIGRARLYEFRAGTIANAAYSSDPKATVREDGGNTALVLAALKLGNDEVFELIEEALRRLVPTVERIRIRPESIATTDGAVIGSKLYFDFRGAPSVPAHAASHGTLIVLSLLTVLYGPHRPNLVLLDDFDHALHPRAQKELVRMLLKLQRLPEFSDLQIVATTHSPYILDEVEVSSVYAFALRDDGTSACRRLSEHPEAERMGDSLTAGQLWTLDSERSWVLGD